MAEEAKAAAAADSVKPVDDTTKPADTPADSAAAEEKQSSGSDAAASEDASKEAEPSPIQPDASAAAEADVPEKTQEAMEAAAAANGSTPAATSAATPAKDNRRKSGSGVPEHKRKTPGKKKAAPELRLNVQPGELYMVSMKGYPPWPCVVCDEDMLPETLLSKRPVSARRIDGTYRADFQEGGKHAKDRRYPIMFLGTNEFAWQVNTDLQPINIDAIKEEVAAGNTGKKKKIKALWEAYEIAAEEPDLQYFKDILASHEEKMQMETEEQAAVEVKQKKKRKSTAAAADDEDVEMEDSHEADSSSKKPKPSNKKRKKADESEGEPEKPVKTPKSTKIKLTTKPRDASATKPKETKAKKAKESENAKPEEKPMTDAERRDKQEKSVLYLRHRLQKGFLARDHPPLEDEMGVMSEYLKTLEDIENLEAEAIKNTKVHKVLRAIIKLASIPKEEQYSFKKRCTDLLQRWSGALLATETSANASAAPSTSARANGVGSEKSSEEKADMKADLKNGDENKEEDKEDVAPVDKADIDKQTEVTDDAKATDADGDVAMADAKTEPAETTAAATVAADEKDAKAAEAATEEPVNSA